jgi:hypothetical protein
MEVQLAKGGQWPVSSRPRASAAQAARLPGDICGSADFEFIDATGGPRLYYLLADTAGCPPFTQGRPWLHRAAAYSLR